MINKSLIFLIFTVFNFSCSNYILKVPFESYSSDFDRDNFIFIPEKVYRYEITTTEGDYFKNVKKIKYIDLKVIGGVLPFYNFDKSYNQTVIQYIYLDENLKIVGTEKTGVIENSDNIWIHPPRWEDFSILNTNSYPFLINEKNINYWEWNLENTFDNTKLVNKSYYKKKTNDTRTKLKVNSKNSKGKSYSKFIYNNEKLLIEMDFLNFDKSRINLKLKQD
jgi:hypothetical protein